MSTYFENETSQKSVNLLQNYTIVHHDVSIWPIRIYCESWNLTRVIFQDK